MIYFSCYWWSGMSGSNIQSQPQIWSNPARFDDDLLTKNKKHRMCLIVFPLRLAKLMSTYFNVMALPGSLGFFSASGVFQVSLWRPERHLGTWRT